MFNSVKRFRFRNNFQRAGPGEDSRSRLLAGSHVRTVKALNSSSASTRLANLSAKYVRFLMSRPNVNVNFQRARGNPVCPEGDLSTLLRIIRAFSCINSGAPAGEALQDTLARIAGEFKARRSSSAAADRAELPVFETRCSRERPGLPLFSVTSYFQRDFFTLFNFISASPYALRIF